MNTRDNGSIVLRAQRHGLAYLTLIFGVILLAEATAVAVPISITGGTYTQDFNTLASAGEDDLLPTGWAFTETGNTSNVDGDYNANAGGRGQGDIYSYGVLGVPERAFGMLLTSNTFEGMIGAVFMNDTGGTITALQIAYTGEQWRLGDSAGRPDRINFQIDPAGTGIGSGAFIAVPELNFTTPNQVATVGALDGNAAGNRTAISHTITGLSILNGQSFAIRWTDTNASGDDDGLAVDDFSLTPTFTAPPLAITVPEPACLTMLAIASAGLMGCHRRNR